jgi:succinyl-CoA synthetase beta subunit
MNIHEYQAKAVLREFGVPVPRGVPAFSVDEAVNSAKDLGGPVWVVKAQIHAGAACASAASKSSNRLTT